MIYKVTVRDDHAGRSALVQFTRKSGYPPRFVIRGSDADRVDEELSRVLQACAAGEKPSARLTDLG